MKASFTHRAAYFAEALGWWCAIRGNSEHHGFTLGGHRFGRAEPGREGVEFWNELGSRWLEILDGLPGKTYDEADLQPFWLAAVEEASEWPSSRYRRFVKELGISVAGHHFLRLHGSIPGNRDVVTLWAWTIFRPRDDARDTRHEFQQLFDAIIDWGFDEPEGLEALNLGKDRDLFEGLVEAVLRSMYSTPTHEQASILEELQEVAEEKDLRLAAQLITGSARARDPLELPPTHINEMRDSVRLFWREHAANTEFGADALPYDPDIGVTPSIRVHK